MDISRFLETLYGDAPGWLTLWTRQNKATHWYKDRSKAAQKALALAATMDVYFGVGLRKKRTAGRGENSDVGIIPGLWVDIDIAGPAHKETNLPPTRDAAIEFLQTFPLQPSILVDSGHGLHGYWLFREPWEFDDDKEREQAADLLERFQGTLRDRARANGWKLDSTHDLARVLRLPGTLNHKGKPVSVTVLRESDHRYNSDDFESHLIDISARPAGKAAAAPVSTEYGHASLIVEHCMFIQHCRDHAAQLPEPEWYAMIANIARAEGGAELAHQFSKPYPGYKPEETDEKIRHALKEGAPHTCEYIQRSLGFTGCPAGGCPVTAPVGFALNKVIRARAAVRDLPEKPEQAFTPEVIGALAILKKEKPAEYAQLKAKLKGKVNRNDLERAVNMQVAENQKLRLVQSDSEPFKLDDVLPDIPLKELRLPREWSFNENGIWQQKRVKGDIITICACPVPVILAKRLRNIDTAEEKVELAFYRDQRWHYIAADRATVFNRQGLIQLGNKGLPVSSESAKYLVKYLDDLERENMNTLPLVRSIGHLGWVDGKQFIPGAAGNVNLDVEEGTGAAAVAAGYREQGSLDEWIQITRPLRVYSIARFMIAAAFAAPFLKIIGQRVFVIHSWGPSRGGKTAALKAALSVWGDPEDLLVSFNATKVGLERLASFYSDLPLGIDERQVVGDRQGFVESLVYLLGLGKGKTRGAKGGGLQQFNTWRTIALTTGEEPLSSGYSAAGVKTRTIELYGSPIPDEAVAAAVHDQVSGCFGAAGPVFIRMLLAELARDPEQFKIDYNDVMNILREANAEKSASHLSAVATVVLADYYASQWVYGMDEDTAGKEADELAGAIIDMLENAADIDEATRAYDYLMSWYSVNEVYFNVNTPRERYGRVEGNQLLIYPTAFGKAMEEGGFNQNRILRDFDQKGIIETEQRKGEKTRRYKLRRWDQASRAMRYFIVVNFESVDSGQ